MSIFNEIGNHLRFSWAAGEFLKEPFSLQQCRSIIQQRLLDREKNLLNVVKRAIYDNKQSPFLKLLNMVDCQFGDFEHLVLSNGIELALKELCQKGVYISYEEFKGMKAVTRGNQTFDFKASDFDNPLLSSYIEGSSGGSRTSATKLKIDIDYLAQRAVYYPPRLDAWQALGLPVAVWFPILPGPGHRVVLEYSKVGMIPEKWFSQANVSIFKPPFKHKMASNFIAYPARLFGKNVPRPEFVPLSDSRIVAQWLADTSKVKGKCLVATFPSSAVRVCQAAKQYGLDIAGTTFVVGGEHVSEGKRQEIEAVGASVFPVYVITEFGMVGHGCANPARTDEVHLGGDSLSLIQHRREVPHTAVSVDAFLFTTLLPTAPKIALNVESGDYGVIETRNCGCKLEELGFTQHIYDINGFDKLTAEGMTFIGTDFVRIIEEVLPNRFGGVSTDYQIVQDEDVERHTSMNVVVSPNIGPLDDQDILQVIVDHLTQPSGRWIATDIWSQVPTWKVKRMNPFATGMNKILPLHIQKKR